MPVEERTKGRVHIEFEGGTDDEKRAVLGAVSDEINPHKDIGGVDARLRHGDVGWWILEAVRHSPGLGQPGPEGPLPSPTAQDFRRELAEILMTAGIRAEPTPG